MGRSGAKEREEIKRVSLRCEMLTFLLGGGEGEKIEERDREMIVIVN
jgi:hypothetical protein